MLRRHLLRLALATALVAAFTGCGTPSAPIPSRSVKAGKKPDSVAPDQLRAWTDDTPAKRALADFITRTTTRESADYIPPAERLAAVSADLLQPAAPALLPEPLREAVAALRGAGYRVVFVSDGDPSALRAAARAGGDIPAGEIVGAYPPADYVVREGRPAIVPRAEAAPVAKPVVLHQALGLRPVIAFGRTAADQALLEYATLANPRPSLALVVGRPATAALAAQAARSGWLQVDPATDWEQNRR
ncbi:MAG: hypothetical protein MUE42_09305 [Opitutaceae bacterium]|jgi:hypothetical protein|nr:hypothetical protein [Opitutaceae bacterium]